jgi:site-specific DNA-methyltransferase (adenine-specific)
MGNREPISEVYNEDNAIGMARYPDKYFDLAIVDPPYGINAEQGTNRASRKQFKDKVYGWDSSMPNEAYFKELRRISKNQIIWGGNYFLEYIGNTRGFIIWDKLNPDRCFADCEFAWTSFDCVARIYKTERVQEMNAKDGGKIHPTQKPVQLYKWLLKNYAKEGDKIIDTHMGSQSSRIACYDGEFDFIGFELDKDYFDAGCKRFENHKAQLKLF